MRMWMVDPKLLCQKHLCGEHQECHSFRGTINKGTSIKGYLRNGLLEVHNLKSRHDELAEEMERRGYNHKSELIQYLPYILGKVDSEKNIEILKERCPKCKERMEKFYER